MPSAKTITYAGLLNDAYYRPTDIDEQEVAQLLRQAEAIPQKLLSSFKGLFHVIDYTQRRHVGLSGQVRNLSGYAPEYIMDCGLEFVISVFQKDDFKIYNENIFNQLIQFLKNTPHKEHGQYLFSFSYRMKKADGTWMYLYQQGSYITDPKTHLPLYCIGINTDVSPLMKDACMVFSIDKKSDSGIFNYINVQTDYYYPDAEESRLSKREREVLGWLADGLSSKEIADKLFLSESTVVNHRKNMLKKTNTKNVAQLICFGIKNGLI